MATSDQKRLIAVQLKNLLDSNELTDYRKITVEIGPSDSGIIAFDTSHIFNQNTSEKDKFFHAHQTKSIQTGRGSRSYRNMRRIELLLRFIRDHGFIWRLEGDNDSGIVKLTLQKPPKFLKKNHPQIISDLTSILKSATGPIKLIVK